MEPADLTDDELASECVRQTGAVRSGLLEELFKRHYVRVARWCFRYTNDRESAADLAQEVFLKAHRNFDSYRGQARFSTWLYSIARNEAINRSVRRGPPMEDAELLADVATLDEGPDEAAVRGQRDRRLHEFLFKTLDTTERTVFTLHYGNDMPLETITRLLRLENASGAKAFIVSARRKLARASNRLRAKGDEL
jgi:RNA polymerase sigma-70 factor, ECF subfamily